MVTSALVYVVLVVAAVLSFTSSLVEATFLSVKQVSLFSMQKDGSKKAKAALTITEEKTRLVSVATLIGTSSNVALATTMGIVFSQAFGALGWLVSVVFGSIMIMIFLDLLPKTIGIEDSVGMAVFLAPGVSTATVVLSPVAQPLMNLARAIAVKISGKPTYDSDDVAEEFESRIEMLEADGRIEPDAGRILRTTLASSRYDVKDAMTPIEKTVSVDSDTTVMGALKVMGSTHHPRMPVFGREEGRFLGVVTFRSLARGLSEGRLDEPISSHTVQAARVEADESMATAADRMSKRGVTIAFVYRGEKIIGVITLSDLLEWILGFKVA
ncbi:MAG: CNNM domain-containing protein [Nitrososphaerales archaeon]|jgi:CBS domain containing-hemolysin-like protein